MYKGQFLSLCRVSMETSSWYKCHPFLLFRKSFISFSRSPSTTFIILEARVKSPLNRKLLANPTSMWLTCCSPHWIWPQRPLIISLTRLTPWKFMRRSRCKLIKERYQVNLTDKLLCPQGRSKGCIIKLRHIVSH